MTRPYSEDGRQRCAGGDPARRRARHPHLRNRRTPHRRVSRFGSRDTARAAAARTRQIRLTSAITILGAADPVRVFEEYASLDLVSGGRTEIIAGRGASQILPLRHAGGADLERLGNRTNCFSRVSSRQSPFPRFPARREEQRRCELGPRRYMMLSDGCPGPAPAIAHSTCRHATAWSRSASSQSRSCHFATACLAASIWAFTASRLKLAPLCIGGNSMAVLANSSTFCCMNTKRQNSYWNQPK